METGNNVFESIFNPRGVAIIGASPFDLATLAQMKTKIRDRLYLVNPKYTEVLGKKCYPSILDVEAQIDYVIIGVSAAALPQVLEECIQKGVKVAQIFTAGFSETGIPETDQTGRGIKTNGQGQNPADRPQLFRRLLSQSGPVHRPGIPHRGRAHRRCCPERQFCRILLLFCQDEKSPIQQGDQLRQRRRPGRRRFSGIPGG